MTVYTITPTTEPLDGWPAEMMESHEVIFEPGDYTARGVLTWKKSGTSANPVRLAGTASHGSDLSAPVLGGLTIMHCDHVEVEGIQCVSSMGMWGANFCMFANCATYGGVSRLLDDASHNTFRRCLYYRKTDSGGDAPGISMQGIWRWRYQDRYGRRGHKLSTAEHTWPENDWFGERCWHNTIEDCVFLNYVDGVAPGSIGGAGWLPYRNRATGTIVQRCIFGLTADLVDENNEWPGENIFCDCKSGGTEDHPCLFRDNLIFGQRKNAVNAICYAGATHIGATHVTFERNIFSDCDSCLAVTFPRDETTTTNGPFDRSDACIRFRDNVFSHIRKTSADRDSGYNRIGGVVFSQGGTVQCYDSHFIDCERLAVQHGQYVPSTFRGNKAYGEGMDFTAQVGRPYSRADWLQQNEIVEGSSTETRTRNIPWTDLNVEYVVPRGW